ncbi:hypothetical protein [Rhodococcus sp. NPDC004095]
MSVRLRSFTLAGLVAAALIGAPAAANAADEWPPIPDYPSPSVPFDNTHFLTPDNPEYWNPFVAKDRLTSPYGTSTRIVCTAFHGVLTGCWQADRDGNPHELVRLPADFPNVSGSSLPGGGPGHYVYPVWSAGS